MADRETIEAMMIRLGLTKSAALRILRERKRNVEATIAKVEAMPD